MLLAMALELPYHIHDLHTHDIVVMPVNTVIPTLRESVTAENTMLRNTLRRSSHVDGAFHFTAANQGV
jgi:hypothetical protein